MSDSEKNCACLLVIPAYEEQTRLPPFLRELVAELARAPFLTHLQIVDDGSSEKSQRALESAVRKIDDSATVRILPIIKPGSHRGKGSAIRIGWENGKGHDWLAFVDADGAIAATEVRRLLEHTLRRSPACCVAVRKRDSGRSRLRGWSGRLFTLLVNGLFHASFQDPQCGCKIISLEAWQKVRARSRENGFCFDLELLLLLRNQRLDIEEITIDWQEKSGGHFHLFPDGLTTLLAALRLRFGLSDLFGTTEERR